MKTEIENRAFKSFLSSINPDYAVEHLFDCMRKGDRSNMSWDLMVECHGEDWKCPLGDIKTKLRECLLMARKQVLVDL